MTEEEFKKTTTYLAWSAGERKTFLALLGAYEDLRLQVGPLKNITRHMLAEAYGSNSVGTASKFMRYIEELKNDQPTRRRRTEPPQQPTSSEPVPPTIQTAFDGIPGEQVDPLIELTRP